MKDMMPFRGVSGKARGDYRRIAKLIGELEYPGVS
jgi:hypothetical protein